MEHNPKLTSSEVAALWSAYMQNSMSYCIVQHFAKVNEDNSMTDIIQTALTNCNFVIGEVKRIFEKEKHAVPIGFTQEDVNLKVGRIYSDLFTLRYIKHMAAAGTAASATFLAVLARKDVRSVFSKTSEMFMKLFNEACDILLEKGVLVRSPIIPPMDKAEYLQSESFLSGLIGQHRPLTVVEMANISINCETNSIGRTYLGGFSQTANLPEVRKYMERGMEIAAKHETVFRDIFDKEGIPFPTTWDSTISKSSDAAFSDKLMMFQVTSLTAINIAAYGASISTSLRKDLGGHYTRLMAEIIDYATDGIKLMIKNKWLEQPPQNTDREALRKRATF
ncbi:DUF3231 family protein [Bacillus sp. BRMEA1]|uniref:DUF3231 family protein n=1 Tax=Neobacillus endophyticus TaxID=2738405 RepID=UPI00156746F2|nr:DUF3231 family protein [Neobacillus endophyticus]NRD80044.1 DUF3231 family protein [Neobacillus endophyticus]